MGTGSLSRATAWLDEHPNVALVDARVLVGPEEREDPVRRLMAASPLPPPRGVEGSSVFGFLACASVVRRQAFTRVAGFHPRFGVGGEEALLALDLIATDGTSPTCPN